MKSIVNYLLTLKSNKSLKQKERTLYSHPYYFKNSFNGFNIVNRHAFKIVPGQLHVTYRRWRNLDIRILSSFRAKIAISNLFQNSDPSQMKDSVFYGRNGFSKYTLGLVVEK